ncbi:MAG TPA: RNA polymerase sigma-54 factor, partial [Deltaproteobacteria bacterium]|nr:RNA polymerase sigma-54 factor [Deltaproteobacteria bacterium]
MALELRQSLGLAQQLIMTPQLQQAIKLLQLSRIELLETISQEIQENCTLEDVTTGEIDQEGKSEDTKDEELRDSSDLPEVTVEERARDDIDWDNYLSEYNTGWASSHYEERETPSFENMTATKTNLAAHLIWQLNMSDLNDREKEIGIYIIGNLNEAGYLQIPLEELAEDVGSPLEEAADTLRVIQNFDPVGVAARDARESLLIQAGFHGFGGTIIEKIIEEHLKNVEEKKYGEIASALFVSVQDIVAAVTVIQGLDPRPGRIYSDEETIYITPDIYVFKVG